MERIPVDGGTVGAESVGTGEPIVMIHGSIMPGTFSRLVREPALSGYQRITYARRGFGPSTAHTGPFSIAQQAADARAVLKHFGIDRAHVVGHSYGGIISIQLAKESPDLVATLSLLEPAVTDVPSAGAFFERVGPAGAAFEQGDFATAIDIFMRAVSSDNYEQMAAQACGERWLATAVAEAPTMFAVELPAIQQWTLSNEEAAAIRQPVLSFLGGASSASAFPFEEGLERQRQWFPHGESLIIPGADHLLQMTHPEPIANGIAGFLARHPLKVAPGTS